MEVYRSLHFLRFSSPCLGIEVMLRSLGMDFCLPTPAPTAATRNPCRLCGPFLPLRPNWEGHFRFQSFYPLFRAENVKQLVLLYVMLFMRPALVCEGLDRAHRPISHGPMSSHWTVTTFDHNLRLGSNQLLNSDRFHTTRLSLGVIQGPRLIKTTTRRKPFT